MNLDEGLEVDLDQIVDASSRFTHGFEGLRLPPQVVVKLCDLELLLDAHLSSDDDTVNGHTDAEVQFS